MASTIKLPRSLNLALIEDLAVELNAAPSNINLQIPSEINYRGFGVLSSFFLLLFTWVRSKKGKLVIEIDPGNIQEVQKFVMNYYGYVSITTVWKSCEIVDIHGNSIKPFLRPFTENMRERINFLEQLPNNELVVPNFDHYSTDKGLSHWFYISNFSFAKAPSELDNSVSRIFEFIGKIYFTRLRDNTRDVLDDTLRIIWELMANTDEHARNDFLDQIVLSPNTRGLCIKIQQSSRETFIKNAKQESGLAEYYASALKPGNNLILEISVFDSGPGLVKRYLAENWNANMGLDNDVDTIKKCLVRGASSARGFEKLNKGYGLDDVLQVLEKKKGFLKIRSGRVNVYRDLIASPYRRTTNPEAVDLFDAKTKSRESFTAYAALEGTQITMAYPLI